MSYGPPPVSHAPFGYQPLQDDPSIWLCGCGAWSGVNLPACGMCGRGRRECDITHHQGLSQRIARDEVDKAREREHLQDRANAYNEGRKDEAEGLSMLFRLAKVEYGRICTEQGESSILREIWRSMHGDPHAVSSDDGFRCAFCGHLYNQPHEASCLWHRVESSHG